MASYMLLIAEPRGQREDRTMPEGEALYQCMLDFAADLKERGQLVMTQSLRSDRDAVRVQVREGRPRLVDGPFAEAKEMIGGFFLIECASRDEAVAIAQQCPAAQWATVEVRELGPCFT
ncbi:YciI family protein [Paraburkholderia kururiensis]|uniref:YciI family protein n=1 Tax=Paraburkholderia kururiensis TaxID=984307 RepID=UPI0039A5CCD4